MRQIRLLLVAAVVASAGLFATVASASAPPAKPFVAEVTEDFTDSCQFPVTCGTAFAAPYGPATVVSEITAFYPLLPIPHLPFCFHDEHTSTLAFRDGSTLALAVVGTLCPTFVGGNFSFSGSFSILPGLSTRRFTEATGSGVVSAIRDNGPIHAHFVGAISRSH